MSTEKAFMRKALSLRIKVHIVSQSVPIVLCPDLSHQVDWALKTITYLLPIVSNFNTLKSPTLLFSSSFFLGGGGQNVCG